MLAFSFTRHLRWLRWMNTVPRHSNTSYRSVLCIIITLAYKLYYFWLLIKKLTLGERFEDECKKTGSRMNFRRRLIVNLFCFYLFQISCFNVVLTTYGDTKICDIKRFFLSSSAWFMKTTNIIIYHIDCLFYRILFDIIRPVLALIFFTQSWSRIAPFFSNRQCNVIIISTSVLRALDWQMSSVCQDCDSARINQMTAAHVIWLCDRCTARKIKTASKYSHDHI